MNRISEDDLHNSPFINKARISEDFGNLLVLSPHPDDETLGCGGLISMLRDLEKDVTVIFITSGDASHPNSATHPPKILAQLREQEARMACLKLKVPSVNVHFMRANDSKLNLLTKQEMLEIVSRIEHISSDLNINTIALPWRRDPHPDHVATYKIGDLLSENLNSIRSKLEYPIWLWKNGRNEDWPKNDEVSYFRLDIGDYLNQKIDALEMHQSQLGNLVKDDQYGFALTANLLEPFKVKYEYFFVDSSISKATLCKEYFEKLYADQKDPWNLKNSAYEKEKYEKSVELLQDFKFEHGLELGCSVGEQTKHLAKICKTLHAVDISEVAIEEAKLTCSDFNNINFFTQDIVVKFPEGKYDLITLCEIGYYLDKSTLYSVFTEIEKALRPTGKILLIHWIAYVPDYPLTGDEVHNAFGKFASANLKELKSLRTDLYRLEIWEKLPMSAD